MFGIFKRITFSLLDAGLQLLATAKRLYGWLVLALITFGVVSMFAPHLFLVGLYKISMVTIAAYGAYWFDRTLFFYARPDAFCNFEPYKFCVGVTIVHMGMEVVFACAQIRRAMIICAAMIAVAMGA